MIERHDPRRLQLLLHQHGEVADAAADVGHRHARLQAMAGQQVPLVMPGELGLVAQDGDEAAFLEIGLAGIEILVVFVDCEVREPVCQWLELASRPSHDARRHHFDPQVGTFGANLRHQIGNGAEGHIVEPRQTLHIEIEGAAHLGERFRQCVSQRLDVIFRLRAELAGDDEFLIVLVEARLIAAVDAHAAVPSSANSAASFNRLPPSGTMEMRAR